MLSLLFLSMTAPVAPTDSVDAAAAFMAKQTVVTTNTQEKKPAKWKLHGSLQTDILTAVDEDTKINTGKYEDKFMTNTYAELHLLNRYFQAGARFEFLEHPLPGFDEDFKGWGVPYFYLKGNYKWAEVTLGDYYDQFGSGLILRAYEQRSLGIDNSLRGARLALKPYKGISLKLLAGQQRVYWKERNLSNSSPWTFGADLELGLDRWIKPLEESGTRLTLGLSAVSNHAGKEENIGVIRPSGEKDQNGEEILYSYNLKMPRNVGAFDVRAQLQKGNYSFLAEYAWKGQDPHPSTAISTANIVHQVVHSSFLVRIPSAE